MFLLLIPIAYGINECKPITEPDNIPCRITSTWSYTPPCNSYQATVFNSLGSNLINYTLEDFGDSGKCSFNWNITTTGSYYFNIENGDTGNIIIQVDNMQIGIILGIIGIIAFLMFLAFKLDDSHFLIRLILIFSSVGLVSLIPAIFLTSNPSLIFYNAVLWIVRIFWIYVGGYIIWWIFQKMQKTVPK